MPHKAKKLCSYPGCPRLTNDTYCEEHSQLVSRQYEQHGRDSHHSKRYGRNWQAIRKAYVHTHPLCERCMKAGRYVPVEEVHHIKPLADGGTNDATNLVSLCHKCHAEIHAEMGTRSHNETVYSYEGDHHR